MSHRSDLRISSMDQIHGSGPHISSMDQIHGQMHGFDCMDQIHGSDHPSLWSMDHMHGPDLRPLVGAVTSCDVAVAEEDAISRA